ncbi:MAG: amino acid ABC transporter substrate-binding protein [Oscillatoriales cyanobacterium]|nr:MAG: amino acid ABC transporter substrate-binding protein [Oscillatoriales cyanobacterium]
MPLWQKAAAAVAAIGLLGGGAYALLNQGSGNKGSVAVTPSSPGNQGTSGSPGVTPGGATTPGNPTVSPTSTLVPPPGPNATQLVSELPGIQNRDRISQGERILFTNLTSRSKKEGEAAFRAKNWQEAQGEYNQAANENKNDPESKIYFNNARARVAGNPITIAVVVPITPAPETAQEILRGVAQYQDEYNRDPLNPQQMMEVMIVDSTNQAITPTLAQDLVNAQSVLGVLGHGLDASSQQAIRTYATAGLPVLSPLTTQVEPNNGEKSTLKMLPPPAPNVPSGGNALSDKYLSGVGRSLANYVSVKAPRSPVAVFYNSDSPYSKTLKEQFSKFLNQSGGSFLRLGNGADDAVDLARPGFDAAASVAAAKKEGAKVIFLAMSRDREREAYDIVQANIKGPKLLLIGGDELYSPQTLVRGDKAIEGLVLAVPWNSAEGNNFAEQSSELWKGRVSWRTSTAYDAARGLMGALKQNPNRQGASAKLMGGIELLGAASRVDTFDRVPLVQAVKAKGNAGPADGRPSGSKYQFDPIPTN